MINRERLILEVRRSRRSFLILVALLIAGAAAFGLIFRNLTFERPWQTYREVRAEFDDVKGIFPGGHQVRINGVKVGIVSKATIVDGRAILTMKIEDKWGPVYRNARMRIRPVTPLQDLYVNIEQRGTPAAGEATKSHVIPTSQTIAPVDISRVLDTFSGNTRQRLTLLLDELGKGLGHDGGTRLRATFAELAPFLHVAKDATTVLAARRTLVRRAVHNFGSLSAALARRDAQIGAFVNRGNATLSQLAAHDRPLDGTLSELAQLMPVMRDSFAEVRRLSGELDPALRGLEPVTDELEAGLKGLETFGRDAVPALRALRPAVKDLRRMATVLSPTSRSLDKAFASLRPQAPQLDRLTQQVVPCLDMTQQFFANTLSVFKFQDAHGGFPRAETTVDLDAGGNGALQGLNTTPLPNCTDSIGG